MPRKTLTELLALLPLGLGLLSLYPLLDRQLARREADRLVAGARTAAARGALARGEPDLVGGMQGAPSLHCWGNIGGCGAGGGSSAGAAGAKWIGRGVTGGYVDLQILATESYSRGNSYSTFNTRIGTSLLPKWNFGLNVPILYKVGDVDRLGQTKTAHIAGFGDLSAEITRKLGITNSSLLTLIVSGPTGAHDAQRQGIVLPQHLQLGSGVLGVTAQFEHTVDRDWGLMIFGGNGGYNGWENGIGDWRAPTFTAYGHLGYIRGPLVPAAGLTLFGKPLHDRERHEDRPDDKDPLFMAIPSLSLEYSTPYLAFLLYTSASFSYNGFENVAATLGVQTSL